jgi:hypothetical protein
MVLLSILEISIYNRNKKRQGGIMNQYRCENCKYRWNLPKGNLCPFQKEEIYYKLKEEVSIPSGTDLFTSIIGCASHSDFQSRDKVLDNLRKFLLAYSQGLPGFVYVYNVEEWINEEELRRAGG